MYLFIFYTNKILKWVFVLIDCPYVDAYGCMWRSISLLSSCDVTSFYECVQLFDFNHRLEAQ